MTGLLPQPAIHSSEGEPTDAPQQEIIDLTTIQDKDPTSSTPLHRSTRISKPPYRLTYSWTVEVKSNFPGEIFAYTALFHQEYSFTDEILAMAASNDPDVMYYHQAMAASDCKEFIKAIHDEVNGQVKSKNFTIIPRSKVPKGKHVLPAEWVMS
jgi:hypothetical protein